MKIAIIVLIIISLIVGAIAMSIAVLHTYTCERVSLCIDAGVSGKHRVEVATRSFVVSKGILVLRPISLENISIIERYYHTAVALNGKLLALIRWGTLKPVVLRIPSFGVLAISTAVPICVDYTPSPRGVRSDLFVSGLMLIAIAFIACLAIDGFFNHLFSRSRSR